MANQRIGLDAVLNLTNFNSNVGVYIASIDRMVNVTRTATNQMNQLGTVAATGLGTAIGIAAAEIAGSLVGSVRALGEEVVQTIRYFEQLTFTLTTVGALSQVVTGETATMEEAINNVTDAVKSQILFLQKRAIFSIFSTEELGNAQKLLQVYGFLPQVASGITGILADAGSAFGWQPDVLIRVSKAIGQIRLEQRLLARDALQLTSAGIDVYGAIARETGLTIDEINDLQRKSALPAETAINAILTELKILEGSGERATFTMQGLLSSLEDIKQISLRDLFSGVFEGFRPLLESIVIFGSSNEFKASITLIGEAIGRSVQAGIQNAIFWINQMILAWIALPPSIKNAIIIFGVVTTTIVAFAGAAGLLVFAIQSLINPFTVATALIGAFISAYSSNFLGLKGITENAVGAANRLIGRLGDIVEDVGSTIVSVLSSATSSILDFMGSVASYGANIAASLAEGMMNIVSFILPVMDLITSTMTFWLAPGSPPRVLPKLEKWGTETANVWLSAWTKADFDILNNISDDIEKVLKGLSFTGAIEELEVPQTLIKLRPAIAEAVNQIRHFGSVTSDTFKMIRSIAGPAANQTIALVQRYAELAVSSDLVQAAQNRLNGVTEKYNALLEPIRRKLSAISELRRRADEDREIIALQRTLNTAGVSALRKEQARLRIQEIQQDRQVRGLERAQTVEETAAEQAIKAAEKRQELAQAALDTARSQIDVQQEQLKLYGDEQRILEQLRKEAERLAKEAKKAFEEQLQKGVKIAKLLHDELKDTVETFRAQYTLQDATATAAEKTKAQLELQAIAARKVVREYEALELGIPLSELERLRAIPVTLKDINKEGKDGVGRGIGDDFAQWAIDTSGELDEFNKVMETTRKQFTEFGKQYDEFVGRLDAMLPSFLRLRGEAGELPPIIRTFGAALAGVAAAEVAGRFITLTKALPGIILGLSNPFSFVTTAIGLFAALWVADWNGMREKTANAIAGIVNLYNELFVQQTKLLDALGKPIPGTAIQLWVAQNLPFLQRWRESLIATFGPDILNGMLAASRASLNNFISNIQTLMAPIIEGGLTTGAISKTLRNVSDLAKREILLFLNSLSTDTQLLLLGLAARIQAFMNISFNPFLIAISRNVPLFLKAVTVAFLGFGSSLLALVPILRNLGKLFLNLLSPLNGVALGALKGIPSLLLNLGLGIINVVSGVLARGILNVVALIGRLIDLPTLLGQLFSMPGVIRTIIAQVINTILALPATIRAAMSLVYAIITGPFIRAFQAVNRTIGIFVATFGANMQHFRNTINLAFGQGSFARFFIPLLAFFRTLSNVFGRSLLNGLASVGSLISRLGLALQSLKTPANIARLSSMLAGLFKGVSVGIGKGVFNSFKAFFTLLGAFDLRAVLTSIVRFGRTLKAVGGLLGGFLNPLNLITFGIDFFATAWNTNISGVENGAKGLVDNLKRFWNDLITGKLWQQIVANTTPWIQRLGAVWSDFQKNGFNSTELRGFLRDLGTAIIQWAQDTGSRIWESLRTFWFPVFIDWVSETASQTIQQLGVFLLLLRDWIVAGGTWIYNLLVNNWIPAFTLWWINGGGQQATSDFLASALSTIVAWIVDGSKWIYDNFIGNWLPAFVNWIVDVTPKFLEQLGVWLMAGLTWIIGQIPTVVDYLLKLAAAFVTWLGPVVQWTLENLGVWIGALLQWVLGTGIPFILSLGPKLISALVSWIFDAQASGKTGLQEFLDALVVFFTQHIIPGFISFGSSIVSGIVAGLGELGAKAWAALQSGFWWAIDQLKQAFGIASPSTWFRDNIGQPIVEGIVVGLEAITDNPIFKLIEEVATSGFGLLKKGAEDIFEGMTETVGLIVEGFVKALLDEIERLSQETLTMLGTMSTMVVDLMDRLSTTLLTKMILLRAMFRLKWGEIDTDTRVAVSTMRLKVVADFETMRTDIGTKMENIKSKVVTEFTNMRTESETQATTMRTNLLGILVGETLDPTGSPTSLLGLLAVKFKEQGTAMGTGFIEGMSTAIKSEESLTLLKESIKVAIATAFAAAKMELESSSPSKRAAREIGLPWIQGAALGIAQNSSMLKAALTSAVGGMFDYNSLGGRYSPNQSSFLPSNVNNVSRSTTYELNVNSNSSSQSLVSDFSILRAMAGA